ncbi:MAG TPA: pyridoxal phosphate-dependent aminotransferase [Polyangia bacterium]|nr:pyridoxal phosphate-dependent aminotransferase [Polyangia bacterium]
MTESNPTRVGLPYPTAAVVEALARGAAAPYQPAPLGLPEARQAVADDYARTGVAVGAGQLVLTASSSESYSFLFKLCCDPGDAVLVPEPSYPLFEYLARLEGVTTLGYRLAFDGEWHVDFASLEEAASRGPRPRAVVVVNPNNPTGSYLKRRELERLAAFCRARELALVSDEVFAPYPFRPAADRVMCAAAAPEATSAPAVFSLGGLSKACGLPHLKLGWIAVGGGDADRALAALELIADTYLSVSSPVQRALPQLLVTGAEIRRVIAARVAQNLAALRAALPERSACSPLDAEGGWSAILRVPAHPTDGDWAVSLARETSVLVHPGYFFDMRGGTFVVVSLLPAPEAFATGIARVVSHIDASLR